MRLVLGEVQLEVVDALVQLGEPLGQLHQLVLAARAARRPRPRLAELGLALGELASSAARPGTLDSTKSSSDLPPATARSCGR